MENADLVQNSIQIQFKKFIFKIVLKYVNLASIGLEIGRHK